MELMQGGIDDPLDDHAASGPSLLCLFLRRRAPVLAASAARGGGARATHRVAATVALDPEVADLLPAVGHRAHRARARAAAGFAEPSELVRPLALARRRRDAGARLVRHRWLAVSV